MIVNKYNQGGGGGGVTPQQVQQQINSALTPYWNSAVTEEEIAEAVSGLATEQYVQEAISEIDLSNYWTSAQTQSAITEVEDHLFDVEQVTASALTELHDGLLVVSGDVQTISAATSGKADAVSVSANNNFRLFPKWNNQGVITGYVGTGSVNQGSFSVNGNNFGYLNPTSTFFPTVYAPLSAGTAGDVLVSAGNGAPVWSAVTIPDTSLFVTSAQVETQIVSKNYITSAATANMVQSTTIRNMVSLSQSAYDALSTKDPNTFYIITGTTS